MHILDIIKYNNIFILVVVAVGMFIVIGGLSLVSHLYSLNGIKAKTVGDGQHGTARWATKRRYKPISRCVPCHDGVRVMTPQEQVWCRCEAKKIR